MVDPGCRFGRHVSASCRLESLLHRVFKLLAVVCFSIDEPSHVAVFRLGKPSLHVAKLMPCFRACLRVSVISLWRMGLGRYSVLLMFSPLS